MKDLFSVDFIRLFAILFLILMMLSVFIISFFVIRHRFAKNYEVKQFSKENSNTIVQKLYSKEKLISDLQMKLDIKKTFEDDLLKTINQIEIDENSISNELIKEIRSKINNLNQIDKKKIHKNAIGLEDKEIFQRTLERLHPDLTHQELILCSYFRMHLSSKEIGLIEGITSGTVRVYKNKIKNKIGLSHEERLNEYLCGITTKKVA